jgi:hypothetical protein
MRTVLVTLTVFLSVVTSRAQCTFHSEPVDYVRYYRAEGWVLPGIHDGIVSSANNNIGPAGLSVKLVSHNEQYVAEFPQADFQVNGKQRRMSAQQMLINRGRVTSWEMNGKAFAYGYSLTPVRAHRNGNKWTIDVEAGCEFDVNFIDDKGDGIFRLLVFGRLDPGAIVQFAPPQ